MTDNEHEPTNVGRHEQETTNMQTISVLGAKGGVGTSTIAAAIAAKLNEQGRSAILVSNDASAILGLSENADGIAAFGKVSVIAYRSFDPDRAPLPPVDFLIFDGGRGSDYRGCDDDEQVVLVTTTCYLALRRITKAQSHGATFDALVVHEEAGRALAAKDVENVTGMRVAATMQHDPAVARAVDAGLLLGKMPPSLVRTMQHLIGALGIKTTVAEVA